MEPLKKNDFSCANSTPESKNQISKKLVFSTLLLFLTAILSSNSISNQKPHLIEVSADELSEKEIDIYNYRKSNGACYPSISQGYAYLLRNDLLRNEEGSLKCVKWSESYGITAPNIQKSTLNTFENSRGDEIQVAIMHEPFIFKISSNHISENPNISIHPLHESKNNYTKEFFPDTYVSGNITVDVSGKGPHTIIVFLLGDTGDRYIRDYKANISYDKNDKINIKIELNNGNSIHNFLKNFTGERVLGGKYYPNSVVLLHESK